MCRGNPQIQKQSEALPSLCPPIRYNCLDSNPIGAFFCFFGFFACLCLVVVVVTVCLRLCLLPAPLCALHPEAMLAVSVQLLVGLVVVSGRWLLGPVVMTLEDASPTRPDQAVGGHST